MTSFLVTKNSIQVRFDIPPVPKKSTGFVLGVDQGAKTCISCSSASGTHFTSTKCLHGWDLDLIMQKLSRKQKGSVAFRKAQEHRKNFINWTINQMDLSGAKELRLEKLFDIRRGKATSRYLSHFAFPLIQRKLQDKCEQMGVLFVLQESPYMSQRCSSCGLVHKNNRIGKTFKCKSCGFALDADLNASRNHLVNLPPIDRFLVLNYNKLGFLWNPGFDGPYSAI